MDAPGTSGPEMRLLVSITRCWQELYLPHWPKVETGRAASPAQIEVRKSLLKKPRTLLTFPKTCCIMKAFLKAFS
jgi:hypothetical protein